MQAPTDTPQRIAIVGGSEFDEAKLEDFLYKLAAKYPAATIVTGNGRGAESFVRALSEALGLDVDVPPLEEAIFGKAAMDCQITSILCGCHHWPWKRPDVIVIVGSPSAARPSIAHAWYKRCIPPKEMPFGAGPSRWWVPLHEIAAPAVKKKTAPKRRATKKQESLAA